MSDLPPNPADDGGDDDLDLGLPEDADDDLNPQDDDAGDAESGAEDEAGEDGQPPPEREQQPRRPSQSQRLRAQLETERREKEEIRQRLAQIEQRFGQPQPDPGAQARARQEEEDRLALLPPQEVAKYYYEKAQAEVRQAMALQELTASDRFDKQAYDNAARSSTLHQRYRERVEAVLRSERQRGNYAANRDAILKYLVGEDAMQRASRAGPGQRREGQRRVAGQTVRPRGGRSDVARDTGRGRNQDDQDAATLRGVTAGDL